MNKQILFLVIFFIHFTSQAKDIIYICFQYTGTIQGWEPHKIKDFELTKMNEDKGFEITFVIKNKDATLKGNKETVPLTKLSDDIFLENTGFNAVLWKVYPSQKPVGKLDQVPTIIISQKSYMLPAVGPSAVTTIFKCR